MGGHVRQVELPPNQMPKISMEGDGTTVPTRFPLASLGQVSLWDLPGQGWWQQFDGQRGVS